MNLLKYSLSKKGLQLKQFDQAGKLLITETVWVLTLLGDFSKLFTSPACQEQGKGPQQRKVLLLEQTIDLSFVTFTNLSFRESSK